MLSVTTSGSSAIGAGSGSDVKPGSSGIATPQTGGVSSFSKTSSQRACRTAGRPLSGQAMPATRQARAVATAAFSRAMRGWSARQSPFTKGPNRRSDGSRLRRLPVKLFDQGRSSLRSSVES